MTDIDDLVQEFRRTSCDGAVGASFFAMLRLLKILQECCDILNVCFDIFPFLRLPSTYLIKMYRYPNYGTQKMKQILTTSES